MTSTITVTNGIGVQAGKVAAYDRVSTFTITGIASAFNGLAVTGLLTTADGATALAPLATGTVTAGVVTLSFDTDTAAMATLMPAGRTADGAGRLTVYATATEADCCVAPVVIMPAAEAGTTTTATDAAAATLAEAQALVDAHNASATAHAALFAAVATLSDATPQALGVAAAGNGTAASRHNHVHPTTGLATSGANSNITSLSGLTTPLSIAQGGTGGTTIATAQAALGVDYLHGIHSGLTKSSLSWSDADKKLTLTDAHTYYYQGTLRSQSANVSVDLDDFTLANGLWYIYYADATGVLTASQVAWSLLTAVPVATVFWNGTAGRVHFEGHGSRRDLQWHTNAHNRIGALISPADFAVTTPSTGTPATINIAGGTLWDEDLNHTVNTMTASVIWYATGASAYTFTTTSNTSVYGASVRYVASDNSYTLTAVDAGKYISIWGYINPDTAGNVIYTVLETKSGTAGYTNVAQARAIAPPNLSAMGLSPELRLAYRWIYTGAGALSETTDYRASSVIPAAGGATAPSAATVTFAPAGTIAATNVQAAIEELDAEKAPMAAVQHLWLGAGAAIARTTNGAATGTVETGTNDVMYDTFDFDSGTDEGIAWVCTLPHWNLGTIKFRPHWTAASGTGTVCFACKARAYANDDALDQDGGTPQTSTDTLITAGDWHTGPASAAITVAGTLAAGQPLIVQVYRDISADDLNADARLLGIEIEYTEASTAEAAW